LAGLKGFDGQDLGFFFSAFKRLTRASVSLTDSFLDTTARQAASCWVAVSAPSNVRACPMLSVPPVMSALICSGNWRSLKKFATADLLLPTRADAWSWVKFSWVIRR
jgi:hypothetical protein